MKCGACRIRLFQPCLTDIPRKGCPMTIKKTQRRSCEERKAFIVAMLNRFLPKVPVPCIRSLTALIGSQDSQLNIRMPVRPHVASAAPAMCHGR